jgi:3-oxoacid CoA-transferase subunit B
MPWSSSEIAARVADEVASEQLVSIGIGIPARVADHVNLRGPVMLHMENGILGLGPRPQNQKPALDIANAEGSPASARTGASFFDVSAAVTMMRGGHLDVAILGAMEVDAHGDIAGWQVPGAVDSGMGGAMDLVVGARRVLVCMSHTARHGDSKLVEKCSLPLTASGVVNMVFTGLGVFEIHDGAFHLVELAPEIKWDKIVAATAGPLIDARPTPSPSDARKSTEESDQSDTQDQDVPHDDED